MSLKVQNLSAKFGTHQLFCDVSFSLFPAEPCALIGPNGSGKTTLLRILSSLNSNTSGEFFFDKHFEDEPIFFLGSQPAYFPDLTAFENLNVYLKSFSKKYTEKKEIDDALQIMEISHQKNKALKQFSKGQLRRFTLAALHLIKPRILFADEPTDGLDIEGQKLFYKTVDAFKASSITIFATHDLRLQEWCSRKLTLPEGEFR